MYSIYPQADTRLESQGKRKVVPNKHGDEQEQMRYRISVRHEPESNVKPSIDRNCKSPLPPFAVSRDHRPFMAMNSRCAVCSINLCYTTKIVAIKFIDDLSQTGQTGCQVILLSK